MSELVFRGRDNEMRELLDFVTDEAGGTFIVCGEMGMGKSRILRELAIAIGDDSHCVHLLELPEKTLVEALFPSWIEQILNAEKLIIESQKSRFLTLLENSPYIGPFIKAYRDKPTKPQHYYFLDTLGLISRELKDHERCIILLDPDKEIADDDGAGNLKYILKRVPPRVKIIVAQRPNDRLMKDGVFLAEDCVQSFNTGNIDALNNETIKQILRESTQDREVKLSDEGIKQLVARINGWPYAAAIYLRWAELCVAKNRLDDLCMTPPKLQVILQQLYDACTGDARTVADWLTASRTPLTTKELSNLSGLSGQAIDEAFTNAHLLRLCKVSSIGAETYEIFHNDLREHIVRRLARRGDWQKMNAQFGAYYAPLLKSTNKEEQNLALAHTTDYLLEAGDKRAFIDAVIAQGETKFNRSMFFVCRDDFEQALAWTKELKLEPKKISYFLGNLGLVCQNLGDLKKAIQYHEMSLAIDRENANRQEEAKDLGNLGSAYQNLGDFEKAAQYHEQSLAITRELGIRKSEARQLGNLGLVYFNLGEFTKAEQHHEQALAISREIGDRQGEAADLSNLGNVYFQQDNFSKVAQHFEQALAIHREIGDRQGEARQLGNLGSVHYRQGELTKAVQYFEQALLIGREIGHLEGIAIRLVNLGRVYAQQGDIGKALAHANEALAIAKQIDAQPLIEDIKRAIEWIEKQ